MHLPSTAELLDLWEAGQRQTLLEKSLHLLRVAVDAADLSGVAAWPIGQRDAHLLRLRESLFGRRLVNRARCPACAEAVEWETDSHDLYLTASADANQPLLLHHQGLAVRYRLPNSYDVLRAMQIPDYQTDSQRLLADCILDVAPITDPEAPAPSLPDSLWPALEQHMAEADPQADIQMQIACPACRHEWLVGFDILSYLWAEIDNWASHRLQEVFVLARAFGWSEGDILQLSPQRRQTYLNLIRG